MKVGRGLARLPMPAPATVIAMIALLVATGGTAWGVQSATKKAAAPCPTNPKISKNSSKCHFPSWNSLDIINNSLKGIDVKNGSLSANDLSGGARAALKGNRGPTGAAGAAGARGLTGLTGPAGPVRLVYVRGGGTSGISNPHGSQTPGAVACPSGYYAIGGGVLTSAPTPGIQQMNSSFPVPASSSNNVATAWGAYVDNTSTTTDYVFWVYAVCTQPSSAVTGKMAAPSKAVKEK